MNKEYVCINENVIVEDENGEKRLTEYSDNVEDILIQENLIEVMESEIHKLDVASQKYKKINKFYVPHFIPIGIIIPILFVPLMFNYFGYTSAFTTIVDTIFGSMSVPRAISTTFLIFTIPFSAIIESRFYGEYKRQKRVQNGINSKLEFLRRELDAQKKKLIELRKSKTRDFEDKNFKTAKVNDREELEVLKSWLDLYFNLGYNGEKYYRYYKKGKLEEELGRYYTSEGVEAAKVYLNEKGPILVKKK